MEKKNLLGLDLQLFGDEEVAGANEVEESATPQEEETTETETAETIESKDGNDEPEQTAEDKPAQSAEMNAQFAAMRRKAESEANQRVEEINRAFAALCQGRVNPDTGKPITTALEYAEALRNQERREIEQNLRDNNVDPDVIKRSIALSPEMQQVRQIIEEAQNAKAMSDIQQDLEEIRKIDPSINSLQDIPEDMVNQMLKYLVGTVVGTLLILSNHLIALGFQRIRKPLVSIEVKHPRVLECCRVDRVIALVAEVVELARQ